MTPICPNPLIVHSVWTPIEPAVGGGRIEVFECPDPACDAAQARHRSRLPCAWAWPYARGKTGNGKPFPLRRCRACHHIARTGDAQSLVISEQPQSFLSNG